ncbi:hypothetical protein [Rheinheimera texasensis]|uniref:hypothetical protein n=1 Tax=Rheinheimera texasensis TaxID=306205 RepID=UPI0004E1AB83|nr:hypothetical protein [Rheinheimera texasensis]
MDEPNLGQMNEIHPAALDLGFRFYKLPRKLLTAIGINSTLSEFILLLAKKIENVDRASDRRLVNSDDQIIRKIRLGSAELGDVSDLFTEMCAFRTWQFPNFQDFSQGNDLICASATMLDFVNGLSSPLTGIAQDPRFLQVLDFYKSILAKEVESVARVKTIKNGETQASEIAKIFKDALDVSYERFSTQTQLEFAIQIAVLTQFASLSELLFGSALDNRNVQTSVFHNYLPTIDNTCSLTLPAKQLISSLKTSLIKKYQTKKSEEEFFRYLSYFEEQRCLPKSSSEAKLTLLDHAKLKKRVQRWQNGTLNINISDFWKMFAWAFIPQTQVNQMTSPPLEVALQVLVVNMYTKTVKTALSSGIDPHFIVNEFANYQNHYEKIIEEFEKWIIMTPMINEES